MAKVQITEEVLKGAIENTHQGKEILAILFNKCGGEIQITEELIRAAVKNNYQGRQMIVFLLDRCESRMLITEQIIKDAAAKVLSRKAEFDKYGSHIGFAGAFQAQLEDSKELLELLLDRRAAEMRTTEGVIRTAACDIQQGLSLRRDRTRLWHDV